MYGDDWWLDGGQKHEWWTGTKWESLCPRSFKGGRAAGGLRGWMRVRCTWTVLLPLLDCGWARSGTGKEARIKSNSSIKRRSNGCFRQDALGRACRLRATLWDFDEEEGEERGHQRARDELGLGHLNERSIAAEQHAGSWDYTAFSSR